MTEKGFTTRLRTLVSRSSSERAFAREVGIPYGTLSGLLDGKSPRLETLIAIASAKGVEYRWLAIGEGSEAAEDVAASPRQGGAIIDPELLGRVVDRIARVYRDEGVRLSDVDLGRLAAERYAEVADLAGDPDEWPGFLEVVASRVRKAIRAAAADPTTVKREA
jgi:transcriptional regulator with XRE-family HTH domain